MSADREVLRLLCRCVVCGFREAEDRDAAHKILAAFSESQPAQEAEQCPVPGKMCASPSCRRYDPAYVVNCHSNCDGYEPKPEPDAERLPHEPGGESCLVAHLNPDGSMAPACCRCKHCHEFIRPKNLSQPCPARR